VGSARARSVPSRRAVSRSGARGLIRETRRAVARRHFVCTKAPSSCRECQRRRRRGGR
jgi:hypothetical protein